MRVIYIGSSVTLAILAAIALQRGEIGTAGVAMTVCVSHACLFLLKKGE